MDQYLLKETTTGEWFIYYQELVGDEGRLANNQTLLHISADCESAARWLLDHIQYLKNMRMI